eukprot:1730089-Rhodomonas_salina.2
MSHCACVFACVRAQLEFGGGEARACLALARTQVSTDSRLGIEVYVYNASAARAGGDSGAFELFQTLPLDVQVRFLSYRRSRTVRLTCRTGIWQ